MEKPFIYTINFLLRGKYCRPGRLCDHYCIVLIKMQQCEAKAPYLTPPFAETRLDKHVAKPMKVHYSTHTYCRVECGAIASLTCSWWRIGVESGVWIVNCVLLTLCVDDIYAIFMRTIWVFWILIWWSVITESIWCPCLSSSMEYFNNINKLYIICSIYLFSPCLQIFWIKSTMVLLWTNRCWFWPESNIIIILFIDLFVLISYKFTSILSSLCSVTWITYCPSIPLDLLCNLIERDFKEIPRG